MSMKLENVEIKARLDRQFPVDDRRLGTIAKDVIQIDTYFACCSGKLKLREETVVSGTSSVQLIHYDRENSAGPKLSVVTIVRILEEAEMFKRMMARAYGILRVIKKHRRLYMRGHTRIHIDQVEEIGNFLELEVVLRPGEDISAGELEAREIMTDLGISFNDLVLGSYSDL